MTAGAPEVDEAEIASSQKVHRARVRVSERRYLFGVLINGNGFLADGGQVLAITSRMEVSTA